MKDELVSSIEAYEASAQTYGNLSEDRTKALDYYLGHPLGNEIDGRSQVISRDVWDTVEWIKPQLADIFCGGDEIIQFSPRGPEDMQAAEQETDFVNYIITQKNDWFTTFYGWSHDALLQKNGYVKAYWDDSEDRTKERYEGLTDDELAVLLQDTEVQVTEAETTETETGRYTSVTLERVKKYGCAKFFGVAPEHVFVDHNSVNLSLQDPRVAFVEHREYKTLTQLRDDGYKVPDDIQDGGDSTDDWEQDLRDDYSPLRNRDDGETDPSMRRLKVRECWIRFDRNDDGRAELLHVVLVGTTILLEEEADLVPVVCLCPAPLPHQHYGLSLADAVMDLQLIKTALLRGSLDNMYLANNGRHVVDEEAINMDDMLASRPGGIVRKKAGVPMGDAIMPLTHSTTGEIAIPMMEYMDRVGQKRTGVNEQSQGLDPNTLNKTATGAQMLMTAAQQRIRFIARIFAETGVKNLFQIVHALTLKHSRKDEIIRVRNRWIQVDPRQWVKRADMQISVALGAGDKQQQIVILDKILQMQTLAVQAGLTSPPKIYNALKRMTQAAGFKDPDEFWDDPTTKPPAPPQPNPEVMKEQAKLQGQMQIEAGRAQTSLMIAREQNALKLQEIRANLELQAANDIRDSERERMKAQYDAQIEQMKIEMQRWQTEFTQEMARLMNSVDNATRLKIAEMSTGAAVRQQDMQAMERQEQNQREDRKENLEDREKQADHAMGAMDGFAKLMKAMTDAQNQIIAGQNELQKTLQRPRKAIRGPDGKITGSELG